MNHKIISDISELDGLTSCFGFKISITTEKFTSTSFEEYKFLEVKDGDKCILYFQIDEFYKYIDDLSDLGFNFKINKEEVQCTK